MSTQNGSTNSHDQQDHKEAVIQNSQTRQAAWIQSTVESDGIILSRSQRYFVTHNIASSGLQTKEAAYLGKPSH